MEIVIVDADNPERTATLNFSLVEEEVEGEEPGGEDPDGEEADGEEVIKSYKASFNLLDPFEEGPKPENSPKVFWYSLTLKQLSISSSPGDSSSSTIKEGESCIFYYNCEDKDISLKISESFYQEIEKIEQGREYQVLLKEFFKPWVKYTYQEEQDSFAYYTEGKKKIIFDSAATFAKEMQELDLETLGAEENFFKVESRDFDIVGFNNENLKEGELQIIPSGSSMFFDDNKNYTFSLLVEKKEDFPLDFFIKNNSVDNSGDNSNVIPPSETEGDGNSGLDNPLT